MKKIQKNILQANILIVLKIKKYNKIIFQIVEIKVLYFKKTHRFNKLYKNKIVKLIKGKNYNNLYKRLTLTNYKVN